ncbi:unnamed protein product [Linum trigynum]|uniref:Uncharacterized protein n=1 Tax=Linum trigynum TaxID=586398 RepID=A0AAV2FW39_9ROSI
MSPAPPQRRRHFTCHRHPTKAVTGFCAACLRERLAGIDPDTHQETPITHLALELRRSKSFSSSSNPNASSSTTSTSATTNTTISEPRRRSCEVRPRNSLSELFHHDDDGPTIESYAKAKAKAKAVVSELEMLRGDEDGDGEIRVFGGDEIVPPDVEYDFEEEDGELKTMKEFIDLEWDKKKVTNSGKSFWEAASVFSKKLGKWQLKQRKKKDEKKPTSEDGPAPDNDKGILKKLKDTLTEVGEYAGRRRSCDADPRHSLDPGRLSIEESRRSFDEPRASWDGYLIGRAYPGFTPLVSVVEDDVKLAVDDKTSVENPTEPSGDLKKEDGSISPGGTAQTVSYYSDPHRRRRSFDRSGSVKMPGLELGDDELKSISNAKVSPETVDLFHHGAKLLVTEKELRDSNWYSVRDCNVVGNPGSTPKDVVQPGGGGGGDIKKGSKFKKLPKWRNVLSMFGGNHKSSKPADVESSSSNGSGKLVVDGLIVAGPLEKMANQQKLTAGSCMVSARNSCDGSSMGAMQRRDQLMLSRNKSARYSPSPNSNVDNGLMRFYLTPLRNDISRSKSGKSRLKNPLSMGRNVL